MLETVEINPVAKPKTSIIWLHGLGADGYDFVNIVPSLNLSPDLNTRFVFPHAPERIVAFAGNSRTRAWFNVINLQLNTTEYDSDIRESSVLVKELIDREIELGVPSDKIVLAGFSQGGVIALHCGLRYPKKLAGILVMSSWLPSWELIKIERSPNNQDTPILMQHGADDELIPFSWAKTSKDYLQNIGYEIELSSYPMQHTICSEEIIKIADWLGKVLVK